MRKYRVNVNGTTYEVVIEEIGGSSSSAGYSRPPIRPAAPARVNIPAPVPGRTALHSPAPAASASSQQISAPMPGNILDVHVSDGQSVKKGDVLMVLEAMKMENEIKAPCDGTVQSVSVSKGTAVQAGTLLCVVK